MENNEAIRKKHALMDWENEKEWQEKVMKDPKASAKEKEFAKKRIAEADCYIKKITEDFVGVMDDGWNEEIKQAVSQAKKSAASVKAGPKVTDPKKRKAAIEEAIKKAGESFEEMPTRNNR